MLYLGTKLDADEFTVKCFPRGDANRQFEYPEDRLLPLMGIITDDVHMSGLRINSRRHPWPYLVACLPADLARRSPPI